MQYSEDVYDEKQQDQSNPVCQYYQHFFLKGDRMTIAVLPKTKIAMTTVFALWMISIFVLLYYVVCITTHNQYTLCVCFLLVVLLSCCLIVGRRFLTTITISADTVASSIFRHTKCLVSLNAAVFYVVMGKESSKKYIVISDKPFLYSTDSTALFSIFYLGANLRKQIIIPYSQEVFDRLSLETKSNMEDLSCDSYQALYDQSLIMEKLFGEWFSFPNKTIIHILLIAAVFICDFAVLLLNPRPSTVIGSVIITLIVAFCLLVIQNSRQYLYLWLFVSRKIIRSKTMRYSAKVNYACITENENTVIDFSLPTYYAKCRLVNTNHHATNYIFVSNNRLALQRLIAAKYDLARMDVEKVVPVLWCKSTAKLIDLGKFEVVE